MNHDHNTQVRQLGRCETCSGAPEREAARLRADPSHIVDTRHVAADEKCAK